MTELFTARPPEPQAAVPPLLTHTRMRVRGVSLTQRDRELVAWVTRHGMVTADQICRRFFGTIRVTRRRLRRLEQAGLIRRDPAWHGLPLVVRTTHRGTELADVDLGPASLDYAQLHHQLAIIDLSEELLAAHPGTAWETEREVRRDRIRAARVDPLALGRRIPDGLLVFPDRHRIAVELNRTPKRSRRLDTLVASYALDRDVTAVWWYLPSQTAVTRMRDVVQNRGLEHLIEPRLRQV